MSASDQRKGIHLKRGRGRKKKRAPTGASRGTKGFLRGEGKKVSFFFFFRPVQGKKENALVRGGVNTDEKRGGCPNPERGGMNQRPREKKEKKKGAFEPNKQPPSQVNP